MESFHLFFGLNLGHIIFSHTDNLFKTLQAKTISACSCKRLAELTIQETNTHFTHFTIPSLRSQQNANLSKIPSTQERENHQIIPLCISLMIPLAKHKIFTQPHVEIATK